MTPFQQNITNIWGHKGQHWLGLLPKITTKLAKKWNLSNLKPVDPLSFNYVLTALQGNIPVVLKIGLDKASLSQEKLALQHYQGQGCVKLIDVDMDNGALLMERIIPGLSLKTLFPNQDPSAVEQTIKIMKQLHKKSVKQPANFPKIDAWLIALMSNNILPEHHLNKAKTLASLLLKTQEAPILLHGDLHHDNIVARSNNWIAIDPKGILGEKAYEVGAFIRNPISELLNEPNAKNILVKRFILFSDLLDLDKQRLINWSYVQAILAACWAIQDNGDPKPWLMVADLIQGLNT